MSYIIAFVTFEESSREFPVQCFRTDIKLGDNVIVRRGDGKLRHASVHSLEYLNWDCNGRIECRVDEASQNSDGQFILPKGAPIANGFSSSDSFIKELRSHGWVPIKSNRSQYRSVFGYANRSRVAYIFVRKNGIDIQMLPRTDKEELKPYSLHQISFNEGTVVRHFLAHTTFNLFEGLLRFSTSFINNEKDLDRYFKPQGSRDKRNEALRNQGDARDAERRRLKAERDYYDFSDLGDYPDDMYLGYHMK